jgi:hypothetical protein
MRRGKTNLRRDTGRRGDALIRQTSAPCSDREESEDLKGAPQRREIEIDVSFLNLILQPKNYIKK